MKQAQFLVPDARSTARAAAMAEMLAAEGWQVELAAQVQPRTVVSKSVTYVPLDTPQVSTPAPLGIAALGPWDAVPWQQFAPHHEALSRLALSRRADVIVAFGIGALGAGVGAACLGGRRLVVDVDRVAGADRAVVPADLEPLVHDLERWLVPYADAVIAASRALAELTALRAVVAPPDVVETRVARELAHVPIEPRSTRSPHRAWLLGPPDVAATFLVALGRDRASFSATPDGAAVALALPAEDSEYWMPDPNLVEALTSGIPVVTSDSAGAAGLVGWFGAGALAARDPASLAAALDWLVCDDSLLERARKGARAASEWLKPERQARVLLSVCENVAAAPPRLSDLEAHHAGRLRAEQLMRNHPHLFGVTPDLTRYERRALGRELRRRLTMRRARRAA